MVHHFVKTIRLPLLVVAGAIPPPVGGQALMIKDFLQQTSLSAHFRVFHWPFHFAQSAQSLRRFRWAKLGAALVAIWRLFVLRCRHGKIDLLLYPIGGPQAIPILRDLFLLPWAHFFSRKVILHFHAGGAPAGVNRQPWPLRAAVRHLYQRCSAGISLTRYGRDEVVALGIRRAEVIPLDFVDGFQEAKVQRGGSQEARLLCLGHICEEKGTLLLLKSVRHCLDEGLLLRLTLAGECLQPWTENILKQWICKLGLEATVEWRGCVQASEKAALLGQAELLIFPSLAPESFGIVMVEGMMWGLPVFALDRRGNTEVLCAPPSPLLAESPAVFSRRLAAVLRQRNAWPDWGRQNREKFLRHYLRPPGPSALLTYLVRTAQEV